MVSRQKGTWTVKTGNVAATYHCFLACEGHWELERVAFRLGSLCLVIQHFLPKGNCNRRKDSRIEVEQQLGIFG